MTPDEILRDSHTRWPMPAGEMERLEKRRWVLELLPKGGVGVEIGVFRGHFSNLICQIAQPRKLYLVDPWTTLGETFGWGKAYTNFDTLPTRVARAASGFRPGPSRSKTMAGSPRREWISWFGVSCAHSRLPWAQKSRK